jgi:hypothetical protein
MRAGVAVTLVALAAASARAQNVVTAGPAGNPVTDGTPRFVITTTGFLPAQLPLQLRLQVSLTSDFAGPFWADTTVTGSTATIVIPRLLPPRTNIYWRTIARTAQGTLNTENATGPRPTSDWISLISPNNPNGNIFETSRPPFVWNAVRLRPPVSAWRFTLQVRKKIDGFVERSDSPPDTGFTNVWQVTSDLESNTPYYWSLTAVASTGDSVTVTNQGSFTITSSSAPIATVMFQPFPNPFPNDRLAATCIWFDLRTTTDVKLDVLDLRGNHVKRILPGNGLASLGPNRWGRDQVGGSAGCDSRFQWDGTDDRGRTVRPGVYLIQFVGDGVTTRKRVLFKGR